MKKYTILLMIFFLIYSCITEETGLHVSVIGYVNLIDEAGVELLRNDSVQVSIEGSDVVKTTNETGKYIFTGLNAGAHYDFHFVKNGYGSKSILDRQFFGEGKPGLNNTIVLYQIPKNEMLDASVGYNDNSITVSGHTSGNYPFKVLAFANDSAEVSRTHHDFSSDYGQTSPDYFIVSFSVPENSYISGTILYIAIYFYNQSEFSSGYNYEKWQYDYSNLTSGKEAGVLRIEL
jgi:hypothetical protein